FGKTVQEYKALKGIKKKNQNLRDHMTDWELIFNMLGEKATTDITRTRDARGFEENKRAAKRGGQIAHNARKELEQETGKSVISKDNVLEFTKQRKLEHKKDKKLE
ncbi:phage antirepressor protein, partial [Candidatus Woesearchaeota archaeon]|nr:phage antirepressor protein [Candidatus Woesearchaeota archaeon]